MCVYVCINLINIYQCILKYVCNVFKGFAGGLDGKESACEAKDPSLIPELVRSPREGNGTPLQYSCPRKPMDRGA